MRDYDYDDERELMGYVFRNYPEIVRSHECLPSKECVRDELPPGMRDAYMTYEAECQRIFDALPKQRYPGPLVTPRLPKMPVMQPELCAAVRGAHEVLERQAFWKKFMPHKDQVLIHRCGRCQRILINDKTRQCLSCGYDWH